MIQVTYLEGLADSPQTFPEVCFVAFSTKILAQQKTEKEKKRLKKAQIELCFISATRGDNAKGLGGTLCRGEFLELLLRLCAQVYPRQALAPHLPGFIQTYFKQTSLNSKITVDRATIRKSKTLNIFLYDNMNGLRMLYSSFLLSNKFTVE